MNREDWIEECAAYYVRMDFIDSMDEAREYVEGLGVSDADMARYDPEDFAADDVSYWND